MVMPTWTEQLTAASKLDTEELRRHASVSIGNQHQCKGCFTCACVVILAERKSAPTYERRQLTYVLTSGVAEGENRFRLQVSGAVKSKVLNITREQLITIMNALSPVADDEGDEEPWRQTACRFCGHDVEGDPREPNGKWTDRGGNAECPTTTAERAGQRHKPILESL